MARKEITITIEDSGRDQGKVFLIKEMAASQAEKWAARAFLALAKSGVDIPDDIENAGLAGIAALGVKALSGMTFAEAEPLLDEMMACVSIIPDPKRPSVTRHLIEDDIEEIKTRLKLRAEVFKIHFDFFTSAAR
jgi:hypothetical protein